MATIQLQTCKTGESNPESMIYKISRSAARNLALRALGLAETSTADGPTGLAVTILSVARCLHVQTGCPGGQMQSRDSVRKKSLTIRSSNE
jgi:hypothetical protein